MADSGGSGSFVPTTDIWDVEDLKKMNIKGDEFKEFLVTLTQNMNLVRTTLNLKDSAMYDPSEFVNGQTFPGTSGSSIRRQVFRKVVSFGALPNSSSKSVAHEISITSAYAFTRIYGTASDPTNKKYIPIPNANVDIHLEVDATNVKITTSGSFSTYTTTYVILEYLKF